MTRARSTAISVLLLAACAVVAVAVAGHLDGLAAGFAHLGPAAVAFVLLALGRYPAERRLLGLAAAASARRPVLALAPRASLLARRPRGGLLVATSLAGRAPPCSHCLSLRPDEQGLRTRRWCGRPQPSS